MKCTAIGCLHGNFPKLDGGDLLIITGDLTATDTEKQHINFVDWLYNQKYKKKVCISGNHDHYFLKKRGLHFFDPKLSIEYLEDSGTQFEGLKIWGSPWSLTFPEINPKCAAFTGTEDYLMEKFEKIPRDTDILITHTPAYGILDKNYQGKHCGSKYLENWFRYVERPKVHVFSHIHEAYGQAEIWPGYHDSMVKSINCSHVNERYRPVNPPINFEI